MKQRTTFKEVLVNCDDQVLVRRLLNQFLTEEQKQDIVDAFNAVARDREIKIAQNIRINQDLLSKMKAFSKRESRKRAVKPPEQ